MSREPNAKELRIDLLGFSVGRNTFLTSLSYLILGSRQARGEDRKQIRVQGIQPRIFAAERNQSREHQVILEQGRRSHRRGSSTGHRFGRKANPDRASIKFLRVVVPFLSPSFLKKLSSKSFFPP